MKDKIELHVTPSKKSSSTDKRGRRGKGASTKKNRTINPDDPREQKYQGIRLYHSDRWKREEKAQFRTLSMVSKKEYLSDARAKDIITTRKNINTLYELAKTRGIAKQEALLRFGTKKNKLNFTRNEAVAAFVTGFKGSLPHTFNRDGNLVAKNKVVAKTRPNSSKGKVGATSTSGFKEFNKDYKAFTKSLLKIFALDSKKAGKLAKGLAKKVKITVKD